MSEPKILKVWMEIRNYLSTLVVFIAVVAAMYGIPQIRKLFPMPSEYTGQPAFIIYTTITIFLFLVAALYVIYPFGESWARKLHKPKSGVLLVIVCLILFGSVWLFPTSEATPSWLETPIRILATVLCMAWAGLLIAAGYLPVWASSQMFRTLLSLSLLGISGEVVWWVGENLPFASLRIYSIGAACLLGFTAFVVVAFVDRLQAKNPIWPIRLISGMLVLAAAYFFLKSPEIGRIDSSPPPSFSSSNELDNAASNTEKADSTEPANSDLINLYLVNWLQALDNRIGDEEAPVIMVAASGGGSRAALFAALILDSLKDVPVNEEIPNSPTAADRVVLISSVSGGSLATGCYTDPAYVARSSKPITTPKNYYNDAIVALIAEEAEALKDNERFQEIHGEVWKDVVNDINLARNSGGSSAPKTSLNYLSSKLVDDMCTDFMAPLLRGVISPWLERGEAVSWIWKKHFFSSTTTATVDPDLKSDPPLWLCNTTHIESGHPLVIGFPPVPQELVRPMINLDVNYDFDLCQWRLERAQAIRVSANFPWGFEVAKSPLNVIEKFTKKSTLEDSKSNPLELKTPMHVIDGGVFDNSGITSIRLVVEAIERIAAEQPTTTTSAIRRQAIGLANKVINKIQSRGVILLEIDSGAKPEPPGAATQVFGPALSPIYALNNSTYFTSERSSSDNLASLRDKLRSPRAQRIRERLIGLKSMTSENRSLSVEDEQVDTFFPLRVTCNEQDNVMTAWALPPEDKARIFVRGMVGVKELAINLKAKFLLQRRTFSSLDAIESQTAQLETLLDQPSNLPVVAEQVRTVIEAFAIVSEIANQQRIVDAAKQIDEYLYARNASPDQVKKTKQIIDQMRDKKSSKLVKQMSESSEKPKFNASLETSNSYLPKQENIKEDFSKLDVLLKSERSKSNQ